MDTTFNQSRPESQQQQEQVYYYLLTYLLTYLVAYLSVDCVNSSFHGVRSAEQSALKLTRGALRPAELRGGFPVGTTRTPFGRRVGKRVPASPSGRARFRTLAPGHARLFSYSPTTDGRADGASEGLRDGPYSASAAAGRRRLVRLLRSSSPLCIPLAVFCEHHQCLDRPTDVRPPGLAISRRTRNVTAVTTDATSRGCQWRRHCREHLPTRAPTSRNGYAQGTLKARRKSKANDRLVNQTPDVIT